mmetsp:Transcript_97325/g.167770  ORF Transcript_97325/g.167770 Transcript_97325/m.167770 type:complete len:251 (-) Transcript_97325:68-820(-)
MLRNFLRSSHLFPVRSRNIRLNEWMASSLVSSVHDRCTLSSTFVHRHVKKKKYLSSSAESPLTLMICILQCWSLRNKPTFQIAPSVKISPWCAWPLSTSTFCLPFCVILFSFFLGWASSISTSSSSSRPRLLLPTLGVVVLSPVSFKRPFTSANNAFALALSLSILTDCVNAPLASGSFPCLNKTAPFQKNPLAQFACNLTECSASINASLYNSSINLQAARLVNKEALRGSVWMAREKLDSASLKSPFR